jgi:hypothetical protein
VLKNLSKFDIPRGYRKVSHFGHFYRYYPPILLVLPQKSDFFAKTRNFEKSDQAFHRQIVKNDPKSYAKFSKSRLGNALFLQVFFTLFHVSFLLRWYGILNEFGLRPPQLLWKKTHKFWCLFFDRFFSLSRFLGNPKKVKISGIYVDIFW